MAAFSIACVFAKSPAPKESGQQAPVPLFQEDKRYDLGSLIDLGLATHPGTRAAWFQARAASAAVGEARAPYFPRISARFEGGSDQWYTPAANGPDNFRREQATTVLALEYLLLDFGRRAADVQRSVALFDAAGLTYERKLQQVVFEVQRCYFAHEAALWRQQAAQAMLEVARTLSATVKKETETGLSATPELLASRKKVLEAEFEMESARSLVRTTLGDLCVAAGLPANSPLKIAPAGQPPSTSDLREKADKLIAQALAVRPDLAARAADVRAREAATRRAKADFLPEVRLEGKYAYSAFAYDARDGKTKGSYAEDLNGYGGFLVASWDIFEGFERIQKERKRKEEEKAAKEELGQARLDATRDVWTAYNENLSAASRVDYAEGFVTSAKETFEAVRSAYESGLGTISEYSEAAGQLAMAQSMRAGALADYSTSLAALAFAAGQPMIAESPPRQKKELKK